MPQNLVWGSKLVIVRELIGINLHAAWWVTFGTQPDILCRQSWECECVCVRVCVVVCLCVWEREKENRAACWWRFCRWKGFFCFRKGFFCFENVNFLQKAAAFQICSKLEKSPKDHSDTSSIIFPTILNPWDARRTKNFDRRYFSRRVVNFWKNIQFFHYFWPFTPAAHDTLFFQLASAFWTVVSP